MANDTHILQEFLVSLGFKLDEAGLKKFREGMNQSTKDALALGGAAIGVGIAVETFVEKMANSLARLFYMSERTGATVAGLKATASAFEGVGLKAGVAEEAITSIGALLRKPGTESMLRGWGINTKQPTENVFLDTAKMLSQMYNVGGGQRYTAIGLAQDWLHMTEEDFVQMTKELPNLTQQLKIANDIIKLTGQNYETAASQGAEFNRQLGIIGQETLALAAKWLHLNGYMNDAVDTAHTLADKLWVILGGDPKKAPNASMRLKPEDEKRLHEAEVAGLIPYDATKDKLIAAAIRDAKKYGLDPTLFYSQIQQESGFNPNAQSKAGAAGIAQFMPKTARGLGFEAGKDPFRDLEEAAKLMKQLLEKYKGNYTLALQAYNAGETRVNNAIAGRGPPLADETQNYPTAIYSRARLGTGGAGAAGASKVFAPNVTQNINIQGDNAGAIGDAVQSKLRRTNADLIRDGSGLLAN